MNECRMLSVDVQNTHNIRIIMEMRVHWSNKTDARIKITYRWDCDALRVWQSVLH